jgi:CxxC motif-containing protein (DUF1111 family)
MARAYRLWYLLALLVAFVPPGTGWLLWRSAPLQIIDPSMAQAGEVLFKRDWKPKDTNCPEGDGLGPVFNATSCVACHHQGGPGGGGGLEHNVTMFTVRAEGKPAREGVVHARGVGQRETLKDVHPDLPAVNPTLEQVVSLEGRRRQCLPFPDGVHLSQRNTPALFGAKLIDEIPESVILAGEKAQRVKWAMAKSEEDGPPIGRAVRLGNGRIGRFGWKAQMASLSDFVQAACANELGLSNPGAAQPTPLFTSTAAPSKGYDLTARQCEELTAFCASLSRPVERLPKDVSAEDALVGKSLFGTIGCADCHTPNLGNVEGLYSDLLLHRMGHELIGGGSYGDPPVPVKGSKDEGMSPSEWRTPPLWGVADSAPYLHDGRAATLEEAIRRHGGQAAKAAQHFAGLSTREQAQLIGFLKTLRAP